MRRHASWLVLLFCLVPQGAAGNPPATVTPPFLEEHGSTGLRLSEADPDKLKIAMVLGKRRDLMVGVWGVRAVVYSYPLQGTCVPETHLICGHQVLIVTSTADDSPEVRAYGLGVVGEIAQWTFVGKESLPAYLAELTVLSYPEIALARNTKLNRKVDRYRIEIHRSGVVTLAEP